MPQKPGHTPFELSSFSFIGNCIEGLVFEIFKIPKAVDGLPRIAENQAIYSSLCVIQIQNLRDQHRTKFPAVVRLSLTPFSCNETSALREDPSDHNTYSDHPEIYFL